MIRRRGKRIAAAVLLGAAWAGPALAESAGCFHFGYDLKDLEANRDVYLGRINTLAPRVNFVKRDVFQKGCPSSSAACRDKPYLVPGDEVVISGGNGDFLCASYAGRNGAVTDGWLPRAAVSVVPGEPVAAPQGWLGTWQSGPEQTIAIGSGAQGTLTIKGNATWGASDPGRVARGAVNIGELDGEAPVRGPILSFGMGEDGPLPYDEADEADCRVQLLRLGSYLLVRDNAMCGGHNVTFTGIYRRQ
ncbi:hypothetical protein KBI52_29875 [Microvirga sp. HBU67558]|uniref:hypothetical protein n=1 Tax=Microvirga TaxID=186650 RepID=UPI001B3702A2|nr:MULTISPECIES: hypothetical protein [unclassified Microvirga]MBQ0824409.1 hypothetical protein [Microvirga sp. HBU67558]